jgi:ParB-like chromosome segregation protein Spo0J
MTKAKAVEAEVLSVPLGEIFVPPRQIRRDDSRVGEIAESLSEHGQIYPILVTRGGPEGFPYTLVEGFTRHAAFLMNRWRTRTILARVVECKDAVDRISHNWIANVERSELSVLDQAECVYNLIHGTYPVLDGELSDPLSKEDVEKHLGINQERIYRLLKIRKNLGPEVAELVRQYDAPVYVVNQLVSIKGEGEDAETREQDRAAKQLRAISSWQKRQEELSAQGRKRRERSDKGRRKGKRGGSSPTGVLGLSKRVQHARYESSDGRKYSVDDYVRVLSKKREALAEERAKEAQIQAARLSGMVDGIRFFSGEIQTLRDLTNADFELIAPKAEAQDQVEA